MLVVCDIAVLTTPSGNTHRAADRRKENRIIADGPNVAAVERVLKKHEHHIIAQSSV